MIRFTIPDTEPSPSSTHLRPSRPILVPSFTVLIDTREQAPWTFQGVVISGREMLPKRKTIGLATGDYSIEGCESKFVLERKSGDDLLGSLGGGHERFRREHERMAEIVAGGGFAAVVIEDSLDRLCDELDNPFSGRRLRSESVLGVVASWPQRYRVQWLFAGSRRLAEVLAVRMMLKWMENCNGMSDLRRRDDPNG